MWKNKNVWILLSGEFIAGLGLWLGIIGNLEFMQEKVPSDFMKSLILASGLLAGLAVGPYAGKLIDRMKKKTVMLAAGFIRVISVVFMLIAIQTGSVLWMVVFLMVIQLSAAFYFPALQAAIPMVVKGKELLQMNGVHMNVSTLSRILGTALGGVLLVIMPLYMLYILSLLAYAILFILTWFLSFQEEEVSTMAKRKSGGFKEVFPVLKNLPIVSMTLIMTLIPLLFIGGFNLMVINISEIQDSIAIKGWIYTAEGLSFMIGAFAVKRIGEKISPYRILFTFSFIIGIAQLILYFAGNPVLSVLSFIIFGFAVGCFFPTAATIFQTRVPKDYHGRFFSFRNMLDRIAFQVVLLMTGLLLDLVGLPVMTVLFGGFSLIMTTIFYVRFKALQEEKAQEINV